MDTKQYCVYIHKNKINQKAYVGITCQKPEYRWGSTGNGYKECPHFWKAISKYGWDNFSHEILITGLSYEDACKMEIELISEQKQTDPNYGYNLSRGGDGLDSEQMKQKWKDETYKAFASKRMKEAWKDPDKRARRSAQAKARWSNSTFKDSTLKRVIAGCGKAVRCIESGVVYETMHLAETKLGLNASNIHRAIRTGYRCGGYHWEYADNVS